MWGKLSLPIGRICKLFMIQNYQNWTLHTIQLFRKIEITRHFQTYDIETPSLVHFVFFFNINLYVF